MMLEPHTPQVTT